MLERTENREKLESKKNCVPHVAYFGWNTGEEARNKIVEKKPRKTLEEKRKGVG